MLDCGCAKQRYDVVPATPGATQVPDTFWVTCSVGSSVPCVEYGSKRTSWVPAAAVDVTADGVVVLPATVVVVELEAPVGELGELLQAESAREARAISP